MCYLTHHAMHTAHKTKTKKQITTLYQPVIALLTIMMNTLVLLPTTTCDTMQCDSIQFWPPSNLTDYHELPQF